MIEVKDAGIVWATGRQFESSWASGTRSTVEIGTGQTLDGWDQGLVGQTVGSRVLLVVPPYEGYGAGGSPKLGIGSNDTLVYVVDILDAY
jgi:peptidylprolyl isomerase